MRSDAEHGGATAASRSKAEQLHAMLFRRYILDAMLAAEGDVVLAVDALGPRRAETPDKVTDLVSCSRPHTGDFLAGEAPVWLTRIGNDLPADEVHGEWIGLAKLSARGAGLVRAELESMRADGVLERASLLELFSRLAGRGERIAVVSILGNWLDVDDAFDLARARNFT
jgi:phosphoenolpyruvate phosphomutase